MSRKLFRRLFALVSMLVLLALVSLGSHTVKAQKTCDAACRNACFADYRQCISLGEEGCDSVLTDCMCGCGCITGC
jgi:hypothetical protein